MPDEAKPTESVQRLEQEVEKRSAVFKKELGLFDLVLTQVVFVVGTIWVGWAAKLGNQQGVFWILAIVTFYLPLAAAVIFINRLAPLEGGLYQWAKLAFNDFVAFMVAWNLWVFAISILAGIGLVITTNISYAIGPQAAWMKEAKVLVTVISIGLIVMMVFASLRGLKLGKWVHNAGGLMLLITFTALILMPFIALGRGTIAEYQPLDIQIPNLTAYNINVFSKLALGALTGFEYIAILAGETKAPARNIARSVLISAPIIAAMFVLGTSAVLAFIAPANVDLIAPIPQVLTTGFGSSGWVGNIVTFTILGVVVRQIALMSIYFAGQHPSANGGGLGQSPASVVFASAPEVQNADELDPVRWFGHDTDRPSKFDRGWCARGFTTTRQCRRGFLRSNLSRAVCYSSVWDESIWCASATLDEDCVCFGFCRYVALYRLCRRAYN